MNQSLNFAAPCNTAPVTLAQLVFSSAEQFAGRTAIEENGESIDFAQLACQAVPTSAQLRIRFPE
ncbi:hypothetical protein [Pseudomonas helleri]|uniref:Uncharacterized protein n=1 Tax=Pseudomonas helleri TaxID=1608996 RepID=A0A6I1WNN4_9PSED|nr:hypothetical protein [Pseudomonas helleri]MQU42947.1 hypothetical protein [Pseudomonas helleri]